MADADFPKPKAGAKAFPAIGAIAGASVPERLRSAVDSPGSPVVFTTSFGIEDQLIAHHVFTQELPIDVVTLDTGRLFPSTYELWQQTEEKYGVRIRSVHPDAQALSALVADQGINGFYHSKEARIACCHVRKVEPLRQALSGASAWVTGLRADQSGHRSSLELATWDQDHGLVKVAPLFDWTREQVATECERLGVPVNALHARGFPSIGCEPCTRAVDPGEPERAGRWWWESDAAKECGLHVDSSGKLARSAAA
ncbi:MAG TPA: phosphoadenylyl-sulfate reductase [Sphingomicrobium sp.]|nr:phosphoadenylyl-sulfate reductase [Sphingomicrobium sp.]